MARYGALLVQCPLADHHKDDLLRRGLCTEAIRLNSYGTLEQAGLSRRLKALAEEFGDSLYEVPGFIRTPAGGPALPRLDGILIPVRDLRGYIIAMQVRQDDYEDGGKYVWLSTAAESSGSPAHYPLQTVRRGEPVRLVEGCLKADIAAALDPGTRHLGVASVGTWRQALPVLKALKPSEV